MCNKIWNELQQFITKVMHTACVLLCCGVVWYQSVLPIWFRISSLPPGQLISSDNFKQTFVEVIIRLYNYMPQSIWIIWRPNDSAMSNRHFPAVEPFSQEQVNHISRKSMKKKILFGVSWSQKQTHLHINSSNFCCRNHFHVSLLDRWSNGKSNSNCLRY